MANGLGDDAVIKVAQHIIEKSGPFLKRVFFYYPFYVEVEGKSQMMNLTVYENSDTTELGAEVAKKFGALPRRSGPSVRSTALKVCVPIRLRLAEDCR